MTRLVGLSVIALAVAGFLVAASGVLPVKASSGRWPITRWMLEFGKQRSVATHSLGVRAPSLDAPWQILKGAGHYETTCRTCHGSPAAPISRIGFGMDPPPPNLSARLARWTDSELFSIVKHGLKWTGMPAWPSQQRDDEVWAMVAFLRKLPGLAPGEYEELVSANVRATADVAQACARCHGQDGGGRGTPAFPRLAGQSSTYLRLSLEAFARNARHSGIMRPIAVGLTPEAIDALAIHYSALEAPRRASADGAGSEPGARIALQGIREQKVPSCSDCHGPGADARNPAYPSLAGQYAEYLVLQLELFARDRRGGSPYADIMRQVAMRLKPEQMRAVARYYASLAPSHF